MIRVLIYNLLISFFVSGVLMLRSDILSWGEFYSTLVPTLVYTYTCGLLTATAMYLADFWCCKA